MPLLSSILVRHSGRARWRIPIAGAAMAVVIGQLPPALAGTAQQPPAGDAVTGATTDPRLLDEAGAMALARATRRPVEVGRLTTETTRVVADPSTGTFVAEVAAQPVRVRDQVTGGWRAVDTTLVVHPDGTVGPSVAPVDMRFSGGGHGPLATVADGGHEVVLAWPGLLPKPVLSGTTATYRGVLGPEIDLVVEVGVTGFRELLVVRSRKAAAHPGLRALRFSLTAKGATVVRDADGSLRVVGPDGATLFTGPPPRMWDSSPVEVRTAPMALELRAGQLTVKPDLAMLADPHVTFPLIIDPALSRTHKRTYWTMVWSNGLKFPNDSTELARVGYDGWSSSPKKSRSFFRFDTTIFAGKVILSAVFAHKQVHSPNHSCSASSFGPGVQLYRTGSISSSTSWSSQPSWAQHLATSSVVHGHESYCSGYTRQEWNAKAGVAYVAAAKAATLTLGLKSADESDRNGWRKYKNDTSYPLLTVTYNSPPNVPSSVKIADPSTACATSSSTPAVINDATPKLQAKLTDPDGSNAELRGRFEVYDGSTLAWSTLTSTKVVSGTTVYATTGTLGNGKTYRFRVRAEETISVTTVSGWSAWCYVKIDTSKPPPPSVTSADYPRFDPDNAVAYGGVGQQGSFTLVAGASDVVGYYYQLNAGPWRSVPVTAGASASVNLVPDQFGINVLHVYTKDSAGNQSVTHDYDFNVARGSAPIGVWHFDEGSGTVVADSSGNGHHATLGAGAVLSPHVGRVGGSAAFDGSGGAASTSSALVDTTKSFTVSAWVRLAANGTGAYRGIVSQNGTRQKGFMLYYSPASQNWAFGMNVADVDVASGGRVYGTQPVRTEVWTHLAGTYDSFNGQIRLFVNGHLVNQAAFTMPWNAGGPLQFGRALTAGNWTDFFSGNIDHVYVWDRVVAAEEIGELANALDPVTGPSPALVGHWPFDETSGTMAADTSVYGKHGTLQAGASWLTDPVRGNVLHLDGGPSGHVTMPSQIIDATGSFTIAVWVNSTSLDDTGLVVAASGSYGTSYRLGLWSNGLWAFARDSQDAASQGSIVYSDDLAEPGSWTHLVAMYDAPADRIFLYVNGVRQGAEDGEPFSTPWQPGNLKIGSGQYNGAVHPEHSALGSYDDLRFYAGTMSPQDIFLLWLLS